MIGKLPRWCRYPVVAATAIVLIGGGLFLVRVPLLEGVLINRLSALGIPRPRLTVEAVEPDRVSMTRIALGSADEVAVDRITIRFALRDLLHGQIRRIEIDRPRLRLAVSPAGISVGSLESLFEQDAGGRHQLALPGIVLRDGLIEWNTPIGPDHLRIDGEVLRTNDDTVTATLNLVGESFGASIRAQIDDPRAAGNVTVTGEASVSAGSGLWRLLDMPEPVSGGGRIVLTGRGELTDSPALGADWSGRALLNRMRFDATVSLRLENLTYADIVTGLDTDIDAVIAFRPGVVKLTLVQPGTIDIDRVAAALIERSGLSDQQAANLTGPIAIRLGGLRGDPLTVALRADDDAMTVRLAATAALAGADGGRFEADVAGTITPATEMTEWRVDMTHLSFRLSDWPVAGQRLSTARVTGTLTGSPTQFAATAELAMTLRRIDGPGLVARGIQSRAAARVAGDGRRIGIRLSAPASIDIESMAIADKIFVDGPLSLVITAPNGPAVEIEHALNGMDIKHAFRIEARAVTGRLTPENSSAIPFKGSLDVLQLDGKWSAPEPYSGTARLEGAVIDIPDYGLKAEGVEAVLRIEDGLEKPSARFGVQRLQHVAKPPAVAPLRISGRFSKQGEAWPFAVTGYGEDGVERVKMTGHLTTSGSGEARVMVPTLTFAPGGLQPRELIPLAAVLEGVRGQAGAELRVRWGADGLHGTGEVVLDNIAFNAADVVVDGLATRLRFDALPSLTTSSEQDLTVRKVDPAIPIENIRVAFRIEDAAHAAARRRLRIARADGEILGGRLAFTDATIEPGAPSQRLTLEAVNLPLERLLKLIDVEGLEGTGLLSGSLPITLKSDAITVRNGLLRSGSSGVIRYRSTEASKALTGSGEQVALMLRVLQDFHYEALSLAIDKDELGAARVLLRMLGQNPAVLEGHPFQFNISLTGNLDNVLAAILAGYQVSNRLLRRALELGR